MPFIVRVETGYLDRDQYQIAVLFQPGKPWAAVAPQPQFNHKLLIHHGASCGADHQTGTAPAVTDSEAERALGLGFATMSHALDNAGHNCNLASEAESLIMTKEYLIEHYGTLRYTIGTGCSGGSLAEQWIANAYPGVYQGIMPTCSFPDAWSTATQFLDYHQTLRYFDDPTQWGAGVTWTPQQMADVEGGPDGVANAQVSDSAQFHVVIPTDPCAGITDQQRYDPTTNPGGVRCTIQDAAINVFGPRPMSLWTPQEKQIGHGFADTPVDNVGVQYGLGALQQGKITPAQFVDLNQKVGGLDPDANHTPRRMRADHTVLANAYRSGMINETNNLNRTAIIDCRGPNPGLFHDAYRAFAVRARLNRAHGNHANQLIWEGPVVLTARQPVRAQRLLGPEPLARRRGEGQGQRHGRPEDRPRQAHGPDRPLLRRQRQQALGRPLPRWRGERRGHPAHRGRRRDHHRHQQVPAQAAQPQRQLRPDRRSPTNSGRRCRRSSPTASATSPSRASRSRGRSPG